VLDLSRAFDCASRFLSELRPYVIGVAGGGVAPFQGGEKHLGAKFTGESCKCTPQGERAPPGRARVDFLRKFGRSGR